MHDEKMIPILKHVRVSSSIFPLYRLSRFEGHLAEREAPDSHLARNRKSLEYTRRKIDPSSSSPPLSLTFFLPVPLPLPHILSSLYTLRSPLSALSSRTDRPVCAASYPYSIIPRGPIAAAIFYYLRSAYHTACGGNVTEAARRGSSPDGNA